MRKSKFGVHLYLKSWLLRRIWKKKFREIAASLNCSVAQANRMYHLQNSRMPKWIGGER